MEIVKASVEMLYPHDKEQARLDMKRLEAAGRTCYKSEANITDESAGKFAQMVIRRGHESVIEHVQASFRIICDRGCCYDAKTEIMCLDGWKNIADVTFGDSVATLSDEGFLEYHKPTNIQKYQFTGNLLAFQNSSIDLLVTPNHNMWVYDYDKRSKNSRIWKFLRADELTNSRYVFDKSAKWNGQEIKEIVIPSHPTKFLKYPEIKISNRETINIFLEFLGLWATDGCFSIGKRSGSSLIITQIKRSGRDRIEELLKNLPFRWRYNESTKSYHIDNLRLVNFIFSLFSCDSKKSTTIRVPDIIKFSTSENIKSFLNGVILGDGNIHKTNNHKVVYTSSKKFSDDLQELFLKSGESANIREQPPRVRSFPNGYESHCKMSYVVSVHGKKRKKPMLSKKSAKKFAYPIFSQCPVYCCTVENHRIYVRRNGKAVWCGNSHELVRHRMASFSQESTRYVNYNKRGMQFIDPSEEMPMNPNQKKAWLMAVTTAENMYNKLVGTGAPPELARSVLPNSLKTELVMTANLREWRHFLKLRCDKAAHPQMRTIANMIRASLCEMYPDVFV